jgi:hypothetical protein
MTKTTKEKLAATKSKEELGGGGWLKRRRGLCR